MSDIVLRGVKLTQIGDNTVTLHYIATNRFGSRPVTIAANVSEEVMKKIRSRNIQIDEQVNARLEKAVKGSRCAMTALSVER